MRYWLLFALWSCVLAQRDFHPLLSAAPRLPGVRLRLQPRGITYLNSVVSNILAEQLPHLAIPDVEQKLNNDQGVIRISRIRVSRFRRAEFHDVSTTAPNRISWAMRNLDLGFLGDLSGAVNIVVPFNLTGQAEVLAEGLTFHLDSSVEKSVNGSAHVSSLSCHTTIRSVDVTNHNGGLFGLAVTVFKQGVSDNVRQLLQGIICRKIRKYIDEDLNQKLAEAQTRSPLSEAIETNALRATRLPTGADKGISIISLFGEDVTKNFFIDFRLKENPKCGTNVVDLASSGEISPGGIGGTPFGPAAMTWPPRHERDDSMLALLVADYLPNSLFYHAYKRRLIKVLLTSETPGVASFLRTSCDGAFCIADLVPQLGDNYPNATIELALSATRAPALLFSEKNGGTISISIGAIIVVYAVQGQQKRQASVIDLDAVADAQLTLLQQNVSGSVQLTKFDLRNRFDSKKITNAELSDISLLISQLLENMLNEMLTNGFPLPIPKVLQLHRTRVEVLTRRLYIRTDLAVDERTVSRLAAKTLFNGPEFGGTPLGKGMRESIIHNMNIMNSPFRPVVVSGNTFTSQNTARAG